MLVRQRKACVTIKNVNYSNLNWLTVLKAIVKKIYYIQSNIQISTKTY